MTRRMLQMTEAQAAAHKARIGMGKGIKTSAKRAKSKPVRPQTPEKAVLSACLQLLAVHPKVAWACRMNVGGMMDARGRYVRFGWRGLSDIIGQLKGGRFLAVECKRPGKGPSLEQLAFLDKVHDAGGFACWVESVDRLEHLLRWTAK